jgi:hypothetical protein
VKNLGPNDVVTRREFLVLPALAGLIPENASDLIWVISVSNTLNLTFRNEGAKPDWIRNINVKETAGDRGHFVRAACCKAPEKWVALCALTNDGHMWFTIFGDYPDPNQRFGTKAKCAPFDNVKEATSFGGKFTDVACSHGHTQTLGFYLGGLGDFHVCGVTDDGGLWHTIRQDYKFKPFGNVREHAGDRGKFVRVACALCDGLHVCGVTDDGGLWHSIRKGNNWSQFGNVKHATRTDRKFVDVACSAVGGDLHVCGVTDDGGLWHSIRKGENWCDFGDVKHATRSDKKFTDVGCGEGNGNLHVCGVTDDGGLLHTIRRGENWCDFGDVKPHAGDPGFVTSVAVSVF